MSLTTYARPRGGVMSKSKEILRLEIAGLRQELDQLKREKAELETLLETNIEHSDSIMKNLLQKLESMEKKIEVLRGEKR